MTDATDCHEWAGARNADGYGVVWWNGRRWMAHRRAWTIANGPIPDGLFVCHKCDNPPCCNPDHLFVGTAADNTRDRIAKGRPGGRPEISGQVTEVKLPDDVLAALEREAAELGWKRGALARWIIAERYEREGG